MDELYELKEKLCKKLKEYNEKDGITKPEEVEMIDTLAHAVKNIDKIIETYEEQEGYSNRGGNSYRNSYESRNPQGNSYARGRGSNAQRDSRGRYSGNDEYSANDLMDDFQRLMDRYR